MTAPEPQEIGPYQLRSLQHKGPPRIYKAFDPRSKREVRLKVYPRDESEASRQIDSLLEALQAALTVRHPAILPAYEVGSTDRCTYVSGATSGGKRLSEALAGGAFSDRRAVVVTRALAEGMASAHERGFVHGDVHPP